MGTKKKKLTVKKNRVSSLGNVAGGTGKLLGTVAKLTEGGVSKVVGTIGKVTNSLFASQVSLDISGKLLGGGGGGQQGDSNNASAQ